jgi:hypothetical protein
VPGHGVCPSLKNGRTSLCQSREFSNTLARSSELEAAVAVNNQTIQCFTTLARACGTQAFFAPQFGQKIDV